MHGGSESREYLDMLGNFQRQVLTKLAMCERPTQSQDMKRFLHMIAPLGLQPFDKEQSRNVALVLSKALDYQNVSQLFNEDVHEP